MLGPDMFVAQFVSFNGGIRQYLLAFGAQRQIYRSCNLGPWRKSTIYRGFDFLDLGRNRNFIGEVLVFAENSQQKMFSFYCGRTVIAGLVAAKKYDSARFFGISLKHLLLRDRC